MKLCAGDGWVTETLVQSVVVAPHGWNPWMQLIGGKLLADIPWLPG